MSNHKSIVLVVAGLAAGLLATVRTAHASPPNFRALMEGDIRNDKMNIQGRIQRHVDARLECSVATGSIGVYSSGTSRGNQVGCRRPTPICFQTDLTGDARTEARNSFIGSLNTRFGTDYANDVGMTTDECRLTREATNFSTNITGSGRLATVTISVALAWSITHKSAQKVTFAANNAYPLNQRGSMFALINGDVITSYITYDRTNTASGSCTVGGTPYTADVKADFNYEGNNKHMCASDHSVTGQAEAVQCPRT